jgi:hypothetical protein
MKRRRFIAAYLTANRVTHASASTQLLRTHLTGRSVNKDSLTMVLASHRLSFLVLTEPDLTRPPHGITLYLQGNGEENNHGPSVLFVVGVGR